MNRKRLILLILVTPLTLIIISFIVWMIRADLLVQEKFASNTFFSPTQYYSASLEFVPNQNFSEPLFMDLLQQHDYRAKAWGTTLQLSDYAQSQGEECQKIYSESVKCFAFHHHLKKKIYVIAADELDRILVLLEVDPATQQSRSLENLIVFPQLFAQYIGTQPILQNHVYLSDVPRQCLDAALAIEDPHFLDHQGVSWRGLLRALWVNLRSMSMSQGGSTITQQLVKNHFLSSERTISRKLKEMILAFIVERRIAKDQILQTYLNIIYLGQQGNFQVRGYASAAQFYFKKNVADLSLSDCALLGAVVNSPGLFNPFKHPERALQRREKVLRAMAEQNRILPEDLVLALQQPLPQKSSIEIRETAPYFIEGVQQQLRTQGFNDLSGFKIYTTLDLQAQSAAQKAVQSHLQKLEETSEHHRKNKSHSLQAVLVASNSKTGEVMALVGGRDHRSTPFNRVFQSARQVGSVFKPLVYLTAFVELDDFSPISILENTAYSYKYQGQTWKPNNYDGKYSESVPAFYALKESLNVPTARLGLKVGLDKIIETTEALGAYSPMKPFPALTLGAFEMTPFEVLQIYTNIARWGSTTPLHLIKSVEDLDGNTIYHPDRNSGQQILEQGFFVTLVSILQEAMISGTGQSAKAQGLQIEIAGKTGTTSDYKDAWFAGFSANHVAVVWTGYDDNTPLQLSGAAGALPIWTHYFLSMSNILPQEAFQWPTEGISTLKLSADELEKIGVPKEKARDTQLLYYKK